MENRKAPLPCGHRMVTELADIADDLIKEKTKKRKAKKDASCMERFCILWRIGEREESGEESSSDDTDESDHFQSEDSPTIYAPVDVQLAALGRRIDCVPGDGNCVFESIARQLPQHSSMTNGLLRASTCAFASSHPECFEGFLATESREQFLQCVDELKNDQVWNVDIGDLVIMIVQAFLNIRIAILRDEERPQLFPDDGRVIDDETIVIIQDCSMTHYDATSLMYWDDGTRAYGSATHQLALFGRAIDPVYPNGNNIFAAIARQYMNGQYSHHQLRQMISDFGKANADLYQDLYQLVCGHDIESFIHEMNLLSEDGYLTRPSAFIILRIFIDRFPAGKVIVVKNGDKELHFPEDGKQMTEEDVVLVRDHNSECHFDATKKISMSKLVVGYGLAIEQVAELRRKVLEQKENADSLFNSIAIQVPSLNMDGSELRHHLCNVLVPRLNHFKAFVPKRVTDREASLDYATLKNKAWKASIRDPVLRAFQFHFQRKIVVIHDHSKPQHFPDDNTPVDEQTIVIVEDHSNCYESRFHGTKTIAADSASLSKASAPAQREAIPNEAGLLHWAQQLVQPVHNFITNLQPKALEKKRHKQMEDRMMGLRRQQKDCKEKIEMNVFNRQSPCTPSHQPAYQKTQAQSETTELSEVSKYSPNPIIGKKKHNKPPMDSQNYRDPAENSKFDEGEASYHTATTYSPDPIIGRLKKNKSPIMSQFDDEDRSSYHDVDDEPLLFSDSNTQLPHSSNFEGQRLAEVTPTFPTPNKCSPKMDRQEQEATPSYLADIPFADEDDEESL